jgi:SIR2-like domain
MVTASLRPDEVFVFVGAGASLSPPAGLPLFDWLRDEILRQLELDAYVAGSARADPAKVVVARGLAPEPLMLDLTLAGIDVAGWLSAVLGGGRPNAAHQVLAALANAGAKIWTVNFDTLIEQSNPHIVVVAWPQAPSASDSLVKAHGSLGGSLIVAADQVLAGLPEAWRTRLADDVVDKTVIFLGYSGRDLDFQPVWNEILARARAVVWFEQRDPLDPSRVIDERRKRLLLRAIEARSALSFPPPASPPRGVSHGAPTNASWDFVVWCRDHGLADADPALTHELFAPLPAIAYPPLPGAREWARPSVLGHLGNYRAARHAYAQLAVRSSGRLRAARALVRAEITHGGRAVAAALRVAELAPSFGRSQPWRETARRKRLTIYHRAGRHDTVLRQTGEVDPATPSTLLIIRAAALRITGSLDEAAAVAEEALRRARAEKHAVLAAHAAYQKNIALLWAERLDEARACLDDELAPYAAIAASRWVAWADFIAAGMAVRDRNPTEALARFALAEARFGAEALRDGVVSVACARLAAHRLARADSDFVAEHATLSRLLHGPRSGQRYYGRGSRFTDETIAIERAEFARVHTRELDEARCFYASAAASRYPLQASLGHLGLALLEAEHGRAPTHAASAKKAADAIGFRLVSARADELNHHRGGDALREVFFC